MILFYKTTIIDETLIKRNRKLSYSKDFMFVPIIYNSKPYILQTPPLFIPFGIQSYDQDSKKYYVNVSLQNEKKFINNCLLPFYEKIKKLHKNHIVENFIKENEYSQWMRLKISEDCIHFNETKEKINKLPPKNFGTFIIHLEGYWIFDEKIFFQWKILQSKIHTPIKLKEYAFIDETPKSIPKPPPLPPPPPPIPKPPANKYQKMLKLGVPKTAVDHKISMDRIQASDLQNVVLKKCKVNENKIKHTDNFRPSLDEIKIALKALKQK
tara:strand:- start:272 stop:1075 length:804 start_codon:yes stop_codon:yes gene_type:complete